MKLTLMENVLSYIDTELSSESFLIHSDFSA